METNVVHAAAQGAMNPADLSELVMLGREAKARQEARIAACEAAVEDMRASFEARLMKSRRWQTTRWRARRKRLPWRKARPLACEGADGAAQGEGGKPLPRIDMTRLAKAAINQGKGFSNGSC